MHDDDDDARKEEEEIERKRNQAFEPCGRKKKVLKRQNYWQKIFGGQFKAKNCLWKTYV